MQEEWRDIVIEKNGVIYDYTGLYQVSNFGRVRSLGKGKTHKQEKILKTKQNKNGYLRVGLSKNGKKEYFSIHRLVATAFIPNPDNLLQVNHKNELKHDNVWTNLEWVTQQYNIQYSSYKRKGENSPLYGKPLSEEHKQKISENHANTKGSNNGNAKKVLCIETGQIFGCIKDANEWLGKGDIGACLKGRAKTAGGYHWQYID